ncbi:nuclear transport factor 2 family protein [Haliangium ochraceum]|uniref:SnoaL-like domain-containing protein n=1 Tax=Haliangium ochraceum (strain DSM 14365 / JCM 11303 / SMP-2) TaxID=502025 RepID=D0LX21_HALO1|nr:nuclear transport factor 2 family protein [Haliangium ochraceum]ACY14268.1 hypothetical protein Hoch_1719 [Haliangium ochraceum DSM 14365]
MLSDTDILEIRNLIARYCLTTDNADADGFMDCWVEPDEFGGYESGPFGSMATWQELREFEVHHVGPGGMANGKRHQATNIMIEAAGEGAAHVTHDLLVLEVAQEPRVIATGRYNKSVVVRTAKGWRFKSRSLQVDPGFFVLSGASNQAQADA